MSTDQNFPSEKVVSELAAPQVVRPLNQRGRVERREVLRAGYGRNYRDHFRRQIRQCDRAVLTPDGRLSVGGGGECAASCDARRLRLAHADEARRGRSGAGSCDRQDNGLDRILELRRQLPDRPSSRGLSFGRPAQRLRVRKLDPGWAERPDLWHPHADPGTWNARSFVGSGQSDLSRRLRRAADEFARECRRDHGDRTWRAHRHLPGCVWLHGRGRAKGCGRLLQSRDRKSEDDGDRRLPFRLAWKRAGRRARGQLVQGRDRSRFPSLKGA